MPEVKVTLRRTLQQIVHCTIEALSAHENKEDPYLILADLEQARALICNASSRLKEKET